MSGTVGLIGSGLRPTLAMVRLHQCTVSAVSRPGPGTLPDNTVIWDGKSQQGCGAGGKCREKLTTVTWKLAEGSQEAETQSGHKEEQLDS